MGNHFRRGRSHNFYQYNIFYFMVNVISDDIEHAIKIGKEMFKELNPTTNAQSDITIQINLLNMDGEIIESEELITFEAAHEALKRMEAHQEKRNADADAILQDADDHLTEMAKEEELLT